MPQFGTKCCAELSLSMTNPRKLVLPNCGWIMGQQDNARASSGLYLHAFPPLSIYVCCIVPNLFWCSCVPVYQLSLLSLPRMCLLLALSTRKEKNGSACKGTEKWPWTAPACGEPVPGGRAERAGLVFSCQSLVEHVHNVHPQPSCLLKQVGGHLTFERHV